MDGHDKIYPIQTFYYNEKENLDNKILLNHV